MGGPEHSRVVVGQHPKTEAHDIYLHGGARGPTDGTGRRDRLPAGHELEGLAGIASEELVHGGLVGRAPYRRPDIGTITHQVSRRKGYDQGAA